MKTARTGWALGIRQGGPEDKDASKLYLIWIFAQKGENTGENWPEN